MICYQKLDPSSIKKNQVRQWNIFVNVVLLILSFVLFVRQALAQFPPIIYNPPSMLKISEEDLNLKEITSSSIFSEERIKRRFHFVFNKTPFQELGVKFQNRYDTDTFLPKYKGYIIQLKEKALLEKKLELELVKSERSTSRFAQLKNIFIKIFLESFLSPKTSRAEDDEVDIEKELNIQKVKIIKEQQSFLVKLPLSIRSKNKIVPQTNSIFNGLLLDVTDAEVRQISRYPEVKGIYPNLEVKANLINSTDLINADDVWQLDANDNNCSQTKKRCLTGRGVTIGIIDTGVDYGHQDLGGCLGFNCKVVGGYDFVNKDNDPMDDNGHGTHVAAIAAGNGVLKGVAPEAKIYAYKVLDKSGSGYMFDIIQAIERSMDPNQDGKYDDYLRVINLSLGANNGNPNDPLALAVDNASLNGVVVVVAAGNSGPAKKTINTPGVAREAITVGAIDSFERIADFSSRGFVEFSENGNNKILIKPDVVAPGVNICAAKSRQNYLYSTNRNRISTCIDDKHIALSGTSMAAPHVAGVAALLKQKYPHWGPRQIKLFLRSGAKQYPDVSIEDQGYGRVDAKQSISFKNIMLLAKLDSNGFIKNNFLEIIGSAKEDVKAVRRGYKGFEKYEIYYGKGDSSQNWVKIKESTSTINNKILASLDLSSLEGQKIYLRLKVYNTFGQSVEDKSLIIPDNFEITSIKNITSYATSNFIHKRSDVLILGKINSYQNNMKHFKIELSSENGKIDKEICNQPIFTLPLTKSLTIKCQVNRQIFSDLPNGQYSLYLSVLKDNTWIKDSISFKFYLVGQLLDNWPVELNGFVGDHLLVDKFSQATTRHPPLPLKTLSFSPSQSESALIFPFYTCFDFYCEYPDFGLMIFDQQGHYRNLTKLKNNLPLNGYLKPLIIFDKIWERNLMVFLNDVFPVYSDGTRHENKTQVIDINGNLIYYWDNNISPENLYYFERFIHNYEGTVFDINNDGVKEIFSLRNVQVYKNNRYRSMVSNNLYIGGWSVDGKKLPGFPIRIEPANSCLTKPHECRYTHSAILFLKDKARNSYNIGVVVNEYELKGGPPGATNFTVYFDIYSLEGQKIKRVNLFSPSDNKLTYLWPQYFAVTDFNNDGNWEAIVSYSILDYRLYKENYRDPNAYQNYLAIINNKGEILNTKIITGNGLIGLVVGDLGYAEPSIVAFFEDSPATPDEEGNILLIFDKNLNILNKHALKDTSYIINGVVIGNVDDDNSSEIIITFSPIWSYFANNPFLGVRILNSQANLKEEIIIPILGEYHFERWESYPILTDINNDKSIDIILQSNHDIPLDNNTLKPPKTRIYVLTFNTKNSSDHLDWPTYLHDNGNTSVFIKNDLFR